LIVCNGISVACNENSPEDGEEEIGGMIWAIMNSLFKE
jgi:hypothetical protein